jgi:hypothetical protein
MMAAQSLRRLLGCMVFFALTPICLWAQTIAKGEISGTVLDPSGAAVPNARVELVERATAASRNDTTDAAGNFVFHVLVPGLYDLNVTAPGFERADVHGVVVQVGQTTNQRVGLVVGTSKQEIQVSGDAAPLVQETQSQIGQVIDRQELDTLPIKNRDFTDLATLVPQVVRSPTVDPTKQRVGNISVAGTGGRTSNIFVDGFEDFDFVIGGLAFDVSPDAIQEFNVVTTRFSAEQARSMAAVINIVQRSGSNQIHGSAFYFFRNQDLAARDFFQDEKSPFKRQQWGGSLGGPLIKDRLFGFVTFEDHHEHDVGIVNTNGVYPQFDGSFPLPFRRDFVTAKLDYVGTGKHRLSARYNLDDFNSAENVGGINSESTGRNNLTTTQSAAGSDTYLVSANSLNTFGFQYFHFKNLLQPFFPLTANQVRPDLVIGTPTGDPQGTAETRYEVKDDYTLTRGAHTIRFGGEYHYVLGSAFVNEANQGSFNFFTDAPLNAPFADLLIQSACNNPNCSLGSLGSSVVGVYVQDDWKILSNLTVNLGLRWDYFSNQNDKNFDGILGLLAPPGSRKSDKKDFGPRVGFAYDPFKTGKFVVRGGYGIYYANLALLDALGEHGFDGRNLGFRVFFDPGGINVANPFPGLTPQQIHALFFGPPQDPIIALDNHITTPYVQYWSGGFQWQLASKYVLSVDGVHGLGVKGILSRDINADPEFNIATPAAPLCQMFGQPICSQFGATTWASNGNTLHYNALVISLTKVMSQRFQFNTSYTYSKADNFFDESVGSAGQLLSNPFSSVADRGPATTDVRDRFVLSGIYDPSGLFPFYGKNWEISLITSFNTPTPYNISTGATQADGITPIRPDGIGRNSGARGSAAKTLALVNAFRVSQGLDPLDRPLSPLSLDMRDTDLRISKGFHLRENLLLKLQGEVYNVFNSANFISNAGNAGFGISGVIGVATSNNVGLPTSTPGPLGAGGPRTFQLAARLQW